MINKLCPSVEAALADIPDGATIMIGGFGTAGMPSELIDGLIAHGARELTIINNNAGNGETGLAALLKARRVRKIVCSFPRQADSYVFDALYRAGEIELELAVVVDAADVPARGDAAIVHDAQRPPRVSGHRRVERVGRRQPRRLCDAVQPIARG